MTQPDMSFRAAAEECRRLAAKTTDPVEKQELQRVADQWLRLAQVADIAQEQHQEDHSLEHEGTPDQAHFPDRDPRQREL